MQSQEFFKYTNKLIVNIYQVLLIFSFVRLAYHYLRTKKWLFGRLANTYLLCSFLAESILTFRDNYSNFFSARLVYLSISHLFIVAMAMTVLFELSQPQKVWRQVVLYFVSMAVMYWLFTSFYVYALNNILVIVGSLFIAVKQKRNNNAVAMISVLFIAMSMYVGFVNDILRNRIEILWEPSSLLNAYSLIATTLVIINLVLFHLTVKR